MAYAVGWAAERQNVGPSAWETRISADYYIMLDTSKSYAVDEAEDVISLIIPFRKQWYQILSLIIGVCASGCVLSPVIILLYTSGMVNALINETPIALILPFVILCFLLLFSYIEILWQLTGREIITMTDDYIHIRHQIQGFGITIKLSADKISGIYVSRQNDLLHSFWTRRSSAFWSYSRGRIAINSGRSFLGGVKTYRFGSMLDEEGTNNIVEIIQKRFPRYKNDQ
jgi:hypothetical protein